MKLTEHMDTYRAAARGVREAEETVLDALDDGARGPSALRALREVGTAYVALQLALWTAATAPGDAFPVDRFETRCQDALDRAAKAERYAFRAKGPDGEVS